MRYERLVIAAWYLLASTNLVVAGAGWLRPQRATMASEEFPCAHHACGCRTAEQCRLYCCCHPPTRRQTAPLSTCSLTHESPKPLRVNALLAARCQGHPDPVQPSLHRLDPHLPVARSTLLARAVEGRLFVDQPIDHFAVRSDPPDKVPI